MLTSRVFASNRPRKRRREGGDNEARSDHAIAGHKKLRTVEAIAIRVEDIPIRFLLATNVTRSY